jgi:hypothetical protein
MRARIAQASVVAPAFAWLASMACTMAPLPAESAWPGSRLALAALPWVTLAGLPRRREDERASSDAADEADGAHEVSDDASNEAFDAERGALGASALWIALALGPLAVAARIDAASGHAPLVLALVGAAMLVAIGALAAASHRARGAGRHALVWGIAVLGLPFFTAVVFSADPSARAGAPGAWLAWIARASPSTIVWEWARDLGHAEFGLEHLLPVASLVVVMLAARSTERAP